MTTLRALNGRQVEPQDLAPAKCIGRGWTVQDRVSGLSVCEAGRTVPVAFPYKRGAVAFIARVAAAAK
jgi:hypothetical protein